MQENKKFLEMLNVKLESFNLLKHPFYLLWNEGRLPLETLKSYAKEYYLHVSAFPRYISNIHAQCTNLQSRQTLRENLNDEEEGENNHPELWLRFADGLGVERTEILGHIGLQSTNQLIDGYFQLVKTDYPSGLGALYAYERQTPEIAESKIKGLVKHYSLKDDRSLQFFTVHSKVDIKHTKELENLIERLDSTEEKKSIERGALKGAQLLWNFLDGIMDFFDLKLDSRDEQQSVFA